MNRRKWRKCIAALLTVAILFTSEGVYALAVETEPQTETAAETGRETQMETKEEAEQNSEKDSEQETKEEKVEETTEETIKETEAQTEESETADTQQTSETQTETADSGTEKETESEETETAEEEATDKKGLLDSETSDTCGDNLIWSFDETTRTLTIRGSGDMYDYTYDSISNITDTPWDNYRNKIYYITFEDDSNGKGLTSIGDYAFYGCSEITILNLPSGLIYIGNCAFSNCSSITSLELPSGLTNIGVAAFSGCSGITSLNLPSGLMSIGSSAFSNCSSITSLELPSGLMSIEGSAFSNCSSITSLELPSGLMSIGSSAFSGCSGITGNLELPSGLTSIEGYAFSGCSGITSLNLPSGLTSIGYYAFYECGGLTGNLELPSSLTSIGDYAFFYCSGITSLELPSSLTSIGERTFSGCSGITSLKLPSDLTSIGERAFFYCSGITGNLELPSSLTSIGDYAFSGCSGITSLELPSDLTSIGECTFSGCSGITGNLKLPDKLTSIGFGAFSDCSGITSLEWPSGLTSIGDSAFSGCSGITGNLKLPDKLTSIEGLVFYGCSGITSLEWPSGLTSIGDSAFSGCSGITGNLKLPDDLTNIGVGAFSFCSGITSLELPSKLTSIGSHVFYGCSGIMNLEWPSKLTSIGERTFGGCSGITSLKLPSSLTSIGDYAFSFCSGITSLELPSELTSIGDYAFWNCSGITGNLELPSKLMSIGGYAFYKCSGITGYICIPATVKSCGTSAFSGCTNLKRHVYIQSTDIDFGTDNTQFKFIESKEQGVVTIHAPKGSTAETFANNYDYYAFEEWDGVTLPDDFYDDNFDDPSGERFTMNEQVPNDEFWVMLVKSNGEPFTYKELKERNIIIDVTKKAELLPLLVYKIGSGDSGNTNSDDYNVIKIKVKPYTDGKDIKKLQVRVYSNSPTGEIEKRKTFDSKGGSSSYMVVEDLGKQPCIDSIETIDDEGEAVDLTRKFGNFYKSDSDKETKYPLEISVSNANPDRYQLVMIDDSNNEKILQEYDNPSNVSYAFGALEKGEPLLFLKAFKGDIELCRAIVRVTVNNQKPNIVSGGTLQIGSEMSVTVPEEVPILGGNELEFDLQKKLPVSVEIGLNDDGEQVLKISGALGKEKWPEEDDSSDDDKITLSNFMDKIKSAYGDMKKEDFEKTRIAGFTAEVGAGIYMEGRYNGNETKLKMDAVLYLQITAESGVTYSTLIGPVPVYVAIKGKISDKPSIPQSQFEVIFEGEDRGIKFPSSMQFENELTVGIKPEVGVGINELFGPKLVGKGDFIWGLKLDGKKKARNTVDLKFGLSLTAQALIFKYSKTLAETTFHLYPNNSSYQRMAMSSLMESLYDEDAYSVMQRDYILDDSAASYIMAYAAQEQGGSANVLINGMYPDAQPKFVSYNGTDYLFYLEDQPSRAVEDKSALVCRTRTGNGWSAAKIINDDGTPDFTYDVASSSDGLYITWLNASKSLAGMTSMSQVMEYMTFSVARLSEDGQVIMLETPKVEEEMLPMSVSLARGDDGMWVYWYANSENDLLNNSNGRNIIYRVEAGTSGAQKIAELDEGIMTFDSGCLGGVPYAAVTADTDGKPDTIEDREIYLIGSDGIKKLTENNVTDSNPQFGAINNEQIVVYYSEGNFISYNGSSTASLLGVGDAGVSSDDFEFVCDGSSAVIIWPETYADVEKMGHSIAMSAYRNGSWTKPVNVAQIDDTLIDFTAKVRDNSGAQLYYTARGSGNGQDIIRLYEADAKEIGKAVFRGVFCDSESYQPGAVLPVDITLENTGNCGVSVCSIFIENSKGERVYTMDNISAPAAGETGKLTISDFKPTDTGDLESYVVKLVCDGNVCDTELLEIGGAEFTLGYRTEYRDGQSDEELLFVTISNDSNFAGDVKFTICGGESGTVLYEQVSKDLQPGYSASLMCSLTELWEKTSDTYITLKAESLGRKEPYLLDNSINIYNYGRLEKEVSVVIEQQEVKLRAGDTLQLETRIYAEEGTDTSLTWESRDSEYATVNGNGLVTAVKPGVTVITAETVDGNIASCTVTVVGEHDSLLPEDAHTITYYDGAQQIVMEPSVFRENEAVLLLAPYKSGYDFAGWYETPDFSGSVVEWIPEGTTTDKIFYAKWAERVREKNNAKTETSLSVEFAGTGIYTYTGAAIKPEVIVRDEGQILQQGVDYTVSYKNNTQAATSVSEMAEQGIAPYVDSSKAPMVLIKGKGNYKGSKAASMNFTIRARELSDASIVLTCNDSMASKTKKGGYADQQLAATLKDGKKTLNKAKDYIITYDYLGEDGSLIPAGADNDMTAVNKPGVYTVHISARIAKDSSGRMIRSSAKNSLSNANYTGSMESFILYVQDSAKILSKAKIVSANTKGIRQGTAGITVEQVIKSITFGSGKKAEVYKTDTVANRTAFMEKFDVTGLDTLTEKVGVGYVTVTAKAGSGYYGSRRVAVKILGTPLSKAVFTQTGNGTTFTYNGTVQTPVYALEKSRTDSTPLVEGKDYTIIYQKGNTIVRSPIAAGNYTAVYTGIGAYTGTVKKSFRIVPLDLAAAYKADKSSVTVTASSAAYNPKGAVPAEVSATYMPSGKSPVTLTAADYTITYSSNKKIGKGSMTLKAKGNYKGIIKNIASYDIVAKSMASEDITVVVNDVFYKAGADIAPKLTVYDNGVKVSADVYTVAFADGSGKLAKYKIPEGAEYADIDLTITAKAGKNYTEGTKASGKLHIYTKNISKAAVVLAPNGTDNKYYYTGQQIKPALQSVTYKESKNEQGVTLANSGTDGYLVSYGTNTKAGSASVTIYGTGKYGGSKTVRFTIYPKWLKWMFG